MADCASDMLKLDCELAFCVPVAHSIHYELHRYSASSLLGSEELLTVDYTDSAELARIKRRAMLDHVRWCLLNVVD